MPPHPSLYLRRLFIRTLTSSPSSSSSSTSTSSNQPWKSIPFHHFRHQKPAFKLPYLSQIYFPHSFSSESGQDDVDQTSQSLSSELLKDADSDPLPIMQRLQLSFSHVKPNAALVLNTLNLSSEAGRTVLGFNEWLVSNPDFHHTDETLSYFVDYFGRRKDFKAIHEILVKGIGVSGAKTLESAIDRLARAGRSTQVVSFFERMEEDYGFKRDKESFRMVVEKLCENGHASNAEKMVKDLANEFFPDEGICDVLIKGWCVDGKLEEAKRLAGEMYRGGFEIGTMAYNALLDCVCKLCRKKDPFRLQSEAEEVLVEMDYRGVPRNVETFNVLINNLCKIRKTTDAVDLFHRMGEWGCRPNAETFLMLVKSLYQAARIGEGDEMIDRMRSAGYGDALDKKAYYEFLHKTIIFILNFSEPMSKSDSFLFFFSLIFFFLAPSFSLLSVNDSLPYLWPLPSNFTFGNRTLSVDPQLSLTVSGNGGNSGIVKAAFDRYKGIIFKHTTSGGSFFDKLWGIRGFVAYDISELKIVVHSDLEDLQLGVDESYSLIVSKNDAHSIIGGAIIEANTVYGALRGLETFSQLCTFNYETKNVQVYQAPWYIKDSPKFAYRGLMIDTSRHYLPVDVIKHIIESMSYAKFNVLHWHIIDEQSFPLEVPSHPNLWKGAYTKNERYTIEDAYEIVTFAKMRGINVLPEVDVPGHAESWGIGYPDLWPSPLCREPLDVSKNFTFDLISGILTDLRKIFPFELFHLGGDEVNTDCWKTVEHVNKWLLDRNFTTKDAYEYFVLRAQEIAISKNWTPVNWEETFIEFGKSLNPKTIVHNWLRSGVCARAVASGFKCIFSNQGSWYLDHLDVPWEDVYRTDPFDGVADASLQKLFLGGQVCMWGETADASNVQQTIWPRAAAAAERLWSTNETLTTGNITLSVLPRLHYFRCLLNRRGVEAAPVTNFYARRPPIGPGSCYDQ